MSEEKSQSDKINDLQSDLQKANDALQNCKTHFNDFILIASHDLQAPLRKLSTFIERLDLKLKDIHDPEIKIYNDRILSTVANMHSLIDGLTELSNAAELPLHFEQCDLNDLFQNILKNVNEENNITVTISDLPPVEGSCIELKHLFKNLLDNAIKFQKKDIPLHINIYAETLKEEEKNDIDLTAGKKYFKIEIEDNGIGFDDQYAKKIFEPFQRLHGKSEYEGNGLGLSICKKIAEKHHGTIFAKGVKNSGARFIVILPEISD